MYNVMDDFRAGRQARQAAEDQNYIQQRRTIEDPYKDRDLARVDAARQAIVGQYGAQAGDVPSYTAVRSDERATEKQPGEIAQQAATLEQTGVQTTGMRQDNEKQLGDETRAAALRGLDAMEALNPKDASDLAQRFTPAMAAAVGINPQNFPQLLEMAQQFPDMPTFFKSMRDGFMGQEKVTSTVSGYTPDGKPITRAIGDRQKPGDLEDFVPVDEQARAANIALTKAQTARALMPPGGGRGRSPEDIAAGQYRMGILVTNVKAKIAEGARTGALMSEGQDPFERAGAWLATSLPIVSEAYQNITDPKAQGLRDEIKSGVAAMLREYTKALGIMSGSINSNFELQNIQQIINNAGSSAEAQMAAIEQVEMLLADPNFAIRVLEAEGMSQAAGMTETPMTQRRPDVDAKYGLGNTD